MSDNLSELKQPIFTTALSDLDDLLTQSGKAFLTRCFSRWPNVGNRWLPNCRIPRNLHNH